jgi:hypothetical protein
MKKQKLDTTKNIYLHIKYGRTGNCKLTASNHANQYEAQRFNAGGGGYCKTSTVLAEFLNANFAEEVQTLEVSKYYGLHSFEGKTTVQGGVGERSIEAIIKALNLSLICTYSDRKGDEKHYILSQQEISQPTPPTATK